MLGTLIESAAARQRRRGGVAVSVAVHAAVIAGLVAGSVTDSGATRAPAPREKVIIFKLQKEPPRTASPRTARPASGSTASAPRPIVAPVTSVHIDLEKVPIGIPPVDTKLFDPSADDGLRDRLTTGVGGGPGGRGGPTGWDDPGGSGVFEARGVDRVAALVRPVPEPRYPALLRGAQVEGRVVVRAVVDTLGRLEAGSLEILRADHDAFAESVRRVAPRLRFTPALVEGRPVRMLIELPFEFRLQSR